MFRRSIPLRRKTFTKKGFIKHYLHIVDFVTSEIGTEMSAERSLPIKSIAMFFLVLIEHVPLKLLTYHSNMKKKGNIFKLIFFSVKQKVFFTSFMTLKQLMLNNKN